MHNAKNVPYPLSGGCRPRLYAAYLICLKAKVQRFHDLLVLLEVTVMPCSQMLSIHEMPLCSLGTWVFTSGCLLLWLI